ncbi:MAG TPA: hypothetical protein PLM07_18935, partial [Candidatus Rifleibacterium sp.]|nr:hypothetical protein [Candidatus Rifleibacterium sp.]
ISRVAFSTAIPHFVRHKLPKKQSRLLSGPVYDLLVGAVIIQLSITRQKGCVCLIRRSQDYKNQMPAIRHWYFRFMQSPVQRRQINDAVSL